MRFKLDTDVDRKRADMYFERLKKDEKIVDITEVRKRRSISQNSYLHLILSFFSLETGYNQEEAKQIYKRVNRRIYYYSKKGVSFIRSSSDLKTDEMSASLDKFRDYCSSIIGLYIPSPDEKSFLEAIEIEIKNQKL